MKYLDVLNLQWFADGDGEGADAASETNAAGQESLKETKSESKEKNTEKESKFYTNEEVDRIINQKFKKWQEQKEKEMDEAKRLAEMNATEKAEYERDQLEKKLNELMRKNTLSEMKTAARRMLSDKGLNISDELVSVLVTDDADKTKKNVEDFVSLYQDSVRKAVDEALKGHTPKTGSESSGLTKDEILKVKNRAERQRLINENIELFK